MRFPRLRGPDILLGSADAHTPVDVHEMPIGINDLSPALDGLRLAVLADLHYGRFIRDGYVRKVVDLVNEARVDIICLLGDLMNLYLSEARAVGEMLRRLRARLGTFACLGNHEHYANTRAVVNAYRHCGIDVLVNDHRRITTEGNGLVVAGVDDFRRGRPDVQKALDGAGTAEPVVLMAHNSDQAESIPDAKDLRVDLVLSGHTHGGQIVLFGRPLRTRTRHKQHASGLSRCGRCRVYTSRGVGMVLLPIRVNCRPEIPILRLERRDAGLATGPRGPYRT